MGANSIRPLKALQNPRLVRQYVTNDVERRQLSFADESDCPQIGPVETNEIARVLGASIKTNEFGEHLAVRCWFSQPASYIPQVEALRLLAPNAPDEIGDPDKWLFLDTETTGLAGGSGTYAFLVGLAWWDGGGLEVEQLFMRDYDQERSLLFTLRERLTDHPVIVTFNGKSFDWPLLETRYRMSRKITVPPLRAHLDFLHPAKNLWQLRLGSVRLSELERHVLGWDRGTDMISGLIPQIYASFLRGADPRTLVPIFNHNQMDLRGLATLSARVLSLLSDAETVGQDGFEFFGVSRICEKRGQNARARVLYQKSIASSLPDVTDRAARRSLARLAKRDGDYSTACELWESAAGRSRHGFHAYEQLAIYYERTVRDIGRAQAITRRALNDLSIAHQLGELAPSVCDELKERFERRMGRLNRKNSVYANRRFANTL